MMTSNKTNEAVIYDNVQSSGSGVVNTASSYTVGPNDNLVICGGNSLAITLGATSNSPVYVTSIDGTTQRTGCTLVANGNSYVIADGGPTAHCIRVAGTALWVIIGAKGI
jgi:hypothetical protein